MEYALRYKVNGTTSVFHTLKTNFDRIEYHPVNFFDRIPLLYTAITLVIIFNPVDVNKPIWGTIRSIQTIRSKTKQSTIRYKTVMRLIFNPVEIHFSIRSIFPLPGLHHLFQPLLSSAPYTCSSPKKHMTHLTVMPRHNLLSTGSHLLTGS